MLKKFSKLLIVFFAVLTIVSSFSFCFADEPVATAETNPNARADAATEEENIHNGDLYILDNTVVMDKLVDGNVYIMGNNVTISGQVNGNLFVFGNKVSFDNCYVRYSIYACANNIYYNGACNDLYATTKKLEMTYDSYVVRDVKAVATSTIFKAAIGRDVDLKTSSVDFGSDKEVPVIYGNLRYSANQEKTLADGIVEGEVHYSSNSAFSSAKSVGENILNVVLSFALVVVTSLVIYALLNKCKSEYVEKLNYSPVEILKAIGIGLLTIIVGAIVSTLLLLTSVGAQLGLIVISLLLLIGLLATPVVAILITNLLKPVIKIEKPVMYYVVLALVSIVLYGLTLIPFFIGAIISSVISWLGYGLIVTNFIPKKEISEEEKAKRLEEKEAKKIIKAENKAKKAELKETKKAEKAKQKEDKKSSK